MRLLFAVGFVAMFVLAATCVEAFDQFVQRDGDRLVVEGEPFRFIGWNVPNLHLLEDEFGEDAESAWRWPDEYEITDALVSARQMGGTVVRPYVISVKREGSSAGDFVHVLAPGEFNEEAFRALDLVLRVAKEQGVRVIIPLVDNWKWWGGVEQYAAFHGKPAGAFWTDPEVIADFEKTVDFVVNRVNTETGVPYRDDPTIFAWETGNELDSPPEWTARIAARLKRLDPNHLVIDGRALHGIPEASLEDPNVDVVTTHHYPNVGNNNAEAVVREAAKARGKRPYFVGEFGFMPPDEAERVLDAVVDEGCAGALYWSLRYHRREGGFYWHSEYASDGLFKAFHWPGFDSGEPYEERRVMGLLRSGAFRIRGMVVPPLAVPEPPQLLPIVGPGLLSWRGSAGAASYVVERSPAGEGAWSEIAAGVSDAATQYRPLFADETAEAGSRYRYRVRAANTAGVSAPSNVVAAPQATNRLFVDEYRGLARFEAVAGEPILRTEGARACREDAHRLRMPPGAGIEHAVEEPIQEVTLWFFAEKRDARLSLQDQEGKGIPTARNQASAGRGDYGYLHAAKLVASPTSETKSLRIVRPADEVGDLQLSRIEIRYGDLSL